MKFNNTDLQFSIDKITSFDAPITVAKAFDDNLDYPYALDIEDESFFYLFPFERDADFDKLKNIVPHFSFIEL